MTRNERIEVVKDLLRGVDVLKYQPTTHGSVTLLAAAISNLLMIIQMGGGESDAAEPPVE